MSNLAKDIQRLFGRVKTLPATQPIGLTLDVSFLWGWGHMQFFMANKGFINLVRLVQGQHVKHGGCERAWSVDGDVDNSERSCYHLQRTIIAILFFAGGSYKEVVDVWRNYAQETPLSSKIMNCAYFDFGDWAVVKYLIAFNLVDDNSKAWRSPMGYFRNFAGLFAGSGLQIVEWHPHPRTICMFWPASNWYQNGKILHQDSTMPPRRQRNIERVDVQAELNELRQSKQTLQQMMTELLHRIPTPDNLKEKCKWSSYRKHESLKNVKDKTKKVGASSFERPNHQQGGGNKERGKGVTSSFKCFRCGEAGHRSYECPKKKVELQLVEEGQGDEEQEPVYDDESEEEMVLKKEDVLIDHSRSPREAIDALDVRSITTRRGSYTQYLVHWQGKPSSEDAWISSEKLKKLDQLLWEDLISNSVMSSFEERENDVGA
ncbi:hypothetical protein Acr_01g0009880 [Actinidia rufa]|uniref:Uncharacterized protein n=1 Tax=Actinidia rufa TaxID=165716 RepID=A0A7J0E5F5_9ERIC|nr:hypothetical protein Acr_01g0009880 [Actinidia rufa]